MLEKLLTLYPSNPSKDFGHPLPDTIINIVIDPKYLAVLSLVRWYALTIMVISINSILLDYNLAKGQ